MFVQKIRRYFNAHKREIVSGLSGAIVVCGAWMISYFTSTTTTATKSIIIITQSGDLVEGQVSQESELVVGETGVNYVSPQTKKSQLLFSTGTDKGKRIPFALYENNAKVYSNLPTQ